MEAQAMDDMQEAINEQKEQESDSNTTNSTNSTHSTTNSLSDGYDKSRSEKKKQRRQQKKREADAAAITAAAELAAAEAEKAKAAAAAAKRLRSPGRALGNDGEFPALPTPPSLARTTSLRSGAAAAVAGPTTASSKAVSPGPAKKQPKAANR